MDDHLEHYGVLGMKWGVRKSPSQSASAGRKIVKKLSEATSSKISTIKEGAAASSARKKQIKAENKLVEQAKKDPSKLTNEELARAAERSRVLETAQRSVSNSINYNTSKKETKRAAKNVDKLSDAELSYRINRLQNEQKLKNLSKENYAKEKSAVRKTIENSGNTVLSKAASGTMTYAGNKFLKTLGLQGLADVAFTIKSDKKGKDKDKDKEDDSENKSEQSPIDTRSDPSYGTKEFINDYGSQKTKALPKKTRKKTN